MISRTNSGTPLVLVAEPLRSALIFLGVQCNRHSLLPQNEILTRMVAPVIRRLRTLAMISCHGAQDHMADMRCLITMRLSYCDTCTLHDLLLPSYIASLRTNDHFSALLHDSAQYLTSVLIASFSAILILTVHS